jgi:carbonic anhydrase/acetyltransferase-like protein (isoleucine patch superfamily)
MDAEDSVEFLPTRLRIDPTVFVAESCTLRGDIAVGALSSLWFHTVLRGDTAPIRIGSRTNIQDASVLHVDLGCPVEIGDDVTVGHGAIVHGARIEGEVLVGMRATVLSGARIGRRCIIGAGALVTEGLEVPAGSLVLGVPGKVVRPLRKEEIRRVLENAKIYVAYAEAHRSGRVAPPGGSR